MDVVAEFRRRRAGYIEELEACVAVSLTYTPLLSTDRLLQELRGTVEELVNSI